MSAGNYGGVLLGGACHGKGEAGRWNGQCGPEKHTYVLIKFINRYLGLYIYDIYTVHLDVFSQLFFPQPESVSHMFLQETLSTTDSYEEYVSNLGVNLISNSNAVRNPPQIVKPISYHSYPSFGGFVPLEVIAAYRCGRRIRSYPMLVALIPTWINQGSVGHASLQTCIVIILFIIHVPIHNTG